MEMEVDGRRFVKVAFHYIPDEDRWPPTEVETTWAEVIGNELVLANITFYAWSVSMYDAIEVEDVDEGIPAVKRITRRGGHNTVRIYPIESDLTEVVVSDLHKLGCTDERAGDLIAVDIPPTVDKEAVKALLVSGYERGVLDYQEAHVSWVNNLEDTAENPTDHPSVT